MEDLEDRYDYAFSIGVFLVICVTAKVGLTGALIAALTLCAYLRFSSNPVPFVAWLVAMLIGVNMLFGMAGNIHFSLMVLGTVVNLALFGFIYRLFKRHFLKTQDISQACACSMVIVLFLVVIFPIRPRISVPIGDMTTMQVQGWTKR